jgi:hypothetical protein
MKLRHRERITLVPAIYILLSTVTWFGAMYFFINKSTTWRSTPAISRNYNQVDFPTAKFRSKKIEQTFLPSNFGYKYHA